VLKSIPGLERWLDGHKHTQTYIHTYIQVYIVSSSCGACRLKYVLLMP